MDILNQLPDIILHLDTHLNQWLDLLGPWLYIVLFLIIFCETGLVVTPFLPGDSLLFALGALTATVDASLKLPLLATTLVAAAILGNMVNYSIGRSIGPKIFKREKSRWFKRDYLLRTHAFYEKHGGKTIILTRFIPIFRTFAPFVAGIGRMTYFRFTVFNAVGGLGWVLLFLLAGYYFGNMPAVKRNFHIVILGIVVVSLIPAVVEYLRARAHSRRLAD
ncbi:MAG: DedA family protein [Deltaproteobacteria bacterium]|nr:DedA family protein [Deltaproteobacteria bacterium]